MTVIKKNISQKILIDTKRNIITKHFFSDFFLKVNRFHLHIKILVFYLFDVYYIELFLLQLCSFNTLIINPAGGDAIERRKNHNSINTVIFSYIEVLE